MSAVVVQDRAETEPASSDDLQVCDVDLPELFRARGLVLELIDR